MTTYTLRKADPATTRTDAVVIGVARDEKGALVACPGGEPVAAAYGRRFAPMLAALGFKATAGEVVRVPSGGAVRAATVVAVGMGTRADLDLVAVRRAAGVAARNTGNCASVALALPAVDAEHVRAAAEGFWSGGYRYLRAGAEPTAPADVIVLSEVARRKDVGEALAKVTVVERLADLARDWVNEPPNTMTPALLAEAVTALSTGRHPRVRAHVYDVDELTELGCGGILAVGLSSANPPCMVRLDYRPAEAVARIALVGKGVTYDSGGLTIKTSTGLLGMKCDMAGAAAVVAAVHAIAELGLPVEVTGWAPMAENAISGTAMRPGDVLTAHDGTTIEIRNTDAEGRLLLADALSMAREGEPDAIVEISTLTAPCVVALGDKVAGLFGDDDQTRAVRAAADARGELVWPMPIPEHIARDVRTESRIADLLQHNWVRFGSASYAASFLDAFTGEVPFAHLDVAGPAYNKGQAWGDVPSGATGFGVRTLVEHAEQVVASAGAAADAVGRVEAPGDRPADAGADDDELVEAEEVAS